VQEADERELRARMAGMSLEQKVRLLTGADFWSLHPEPAAGLRRLVVSDGPAGVRGERWDERDTSANVPSPTALAATWDERLVERVGALLAFEARRKGVDVLLAPTVNLHRTPFGGRHFECFSEDPLLTARIGVAFVRGVQDGGVGATVKHFVANDSETQRMTLDAHVGERALRELYLAPFEATVREGGAWSVMAAYNAVNGAAMTESPLLRDVLLDEWGFDGVVMSDWFATRSTAASAGAALDLVMPGPDGPWGPALVAAVRAGDVDEALIDDKVLRILRLAARVGALEGTSPAAVPSFDSSEVASTLRDAAAAGFVLVRNERSLLPLRGGALSRLAVLGPSAARARTVGGGSATVYPPYVSSPLDGLRDALGGGVEIEHRVGVLPSDRIPVAGPPWLHAPGGGAGVEVRFLADDGTVLASEHRPGCLFNWLGSFGHELTIGDVARVEAHAVLRATDAGTYAIGGSGVGRFTLSVGGELVFDGRLELAPGADLIESQLIPPQAIHDVVLERGAEIEVELAHEVDAGALAAAMQLNLQPPHRGDDEEIERAVALAAAADVAVVVVGTTEEVESEGWDRATLALPGRQDELVARVAAANPKTVVVVNAGAPVLLPWAADVAAILIAWFPGQEFGNALADVLLGTAEPGGRLPTTWPTSDDGLPSTQPVDGVLSYDEGLFVGYRAYDRDGRAARYRFGHGLGYTSWEYGSISAPAQVAAGSGVAVAVTLRNSGRRRGREVVQVYASCPDGAVERPQRWLAGFAGVEADAGEEVTVAVTVGARAFEHWDVAGGGWRTELATFVLAAGGSSASLPLSTQIAIARR
jgi:beta-glucosidase